MKINDLIHLNFWSQQTRTGKTITMSHFWLLHLLTAKKSTMRTALQNLANFRKTEAKGLNPQIVEDCMYILSFKGIVKI